MSRRTYGISKNRRAITDTARHAPRYTRLTHARISHGLLEYSTRAPSTTPTPSTRNHDMNRNVMNPRTARIARSCIAPQMTNVVIKAAAGGKARFSGWNTNLAKAYPHIGFQYRQNPANEPAPRERWNMFDSEPDAPMATPLRWRTYWERVSRRGCVRTVDSVGTVLMCLSSTLATFMNDSSKRGLAGHDTDVF